MEKIIYNTTAEEALKRLIEGNKKYLKNRGSKIQAEESIIARSAIEGQRPYAIVITCSDSRVIPEAIFSAGIGDIFVIRVAGNVIDAHQLGSIEYAEEHLGTGLVLVLGHTGCGAVDAVLSGHSGTYIKYIADSIKQAVGTEKDPYKACELNVKNSCKIIEESLIIRKDEKEYGLKVMGAIYDITTGKVNFL